MNEPTIRTHETLSYIGLGLVVVGTGCFALATKFFPVEDKGAMENPDNKYSFKILYKAARDLNKSKNKNKVEIISTLLIAIGTILQFYSTGKISDINQNEIKVLTAAVNDTTTNRVNRNTNNNFKYFSKVNADEFARVGYKFDSATGQYQKTIQEGFKAAKLGSLPAPVFQMKENDASLIYDSVINQYGFTVNIHLSGRPVLIKSMTFFAVTKLTDETEKALPASLIVARELELPVGPYVFTTYSNSPKYSGTNFKAVDFIITIKYLSTASDSTRTAQLYYRYSALSKTVLILQKQEGLAIMQKYNTWFSRERLLSTADR